LFINKIYNALFFCFFSQYIIGVKNDDSFISQLRSVEEWLDLGENEKIKKMMNLSLPNGYE